MGVSTDGQINYGFQLDYDEEQPWADFDEVEEWWLEVNGYENPYSYPEQKDLYFQYSRDWDKENPMPIQLVNYCSDRYRLYILALNEPSLTASRGYPESFKPSELVVTEEQRQELMMFCEKYDVKVEGDEPEWWLSSYWG